MSEIDISYKGSTIATMDASGTKTLLTSGKYCEDDIEVVYTRPSGGGGGASKKQINFIDYDGTILHSYTKSEWQSVSALPSNPSHTGLTAQGWNWTKAQIDTQLTDAPDGDVWVGQMYVTTSGDTEIDVSFADSARRSPYFTCAVNGEISIDWGDNTTPSTLTGSSLTTIRSSQHVYSSTGDYTIKIHVVSGSWAFYGSTSIPCFLNANNSNTVTANAVYSNCVQSIRIGNNVSVGNNAFTYCYSLESITIPSSVTSVSSSTFDNCFSLKSATIPSGVTSLTFRACYSLTSVAIPSSITSFSSTFDYCASLKSVTIPSGVTSISDNTFRYCYSLESITIPSSVTSIGKTAFYYCYSLRKITILSNSVSSFSSSVFTYCHSLASITIPSSVTYLGSYAFQYCYSLASITIPSGVTSIMGSAFQGCYGVAEYHILPSNPPTLSSTTAFDGIQSNCVIYVPSASLSDYQTASNWSTYASYMQGE